MSIPKVWADDLSLTIVCTFRFIGGHPPPAIKEMLAGLRANGYVISGNLAAVGSCMMVVRRVVDTVGGPALNTLVIGKDLDIDIGGGRHIAMKAHKKRISAGLAKCASAAWAAQPW